MFNLFKKIKPVEREYEVIDITYVIHFKNGGLTTIIKTLTPKIIAHYNNKNLTRVVHENIGGYVDFGYNVLSYGQNDITTTVPYTEIEEVNKTQRISKIKLTTYER